jgi:hypothetical protein
MIRQDEDFTNWGVFDAECADCDLPIVKAESTVVRKAIGYVHICAACDQRAFPQSDPDTTMNDLAFDIWREEQMEEQAS